MRILLRKSAQHPRFIGARVFLSAEFLFELSSNIGRIPNNHQTIASSLTQHPQLKPGRYIKNKKTDAKYK